MTSYHTPIMVREVIEGLRVEKGKRFVDATLGGGGHTSEIVLNGGIVLGIDADSDAISFAYNRLKELDSDKKEGKDWILAKGNFRDMASIAGQHGFESVSGVLMDLGVSSFQLDMEAKGFSYRFADGPLDMRFDQATGETARDLVNSASREELYEIFTKYGEEERAWPIVDALVRARQVKKLETTGDLIRVVKGVVGDNSGTAGVLSRIFQALRIQTNEEMQALTEGLAGAHQILAVGGILAVITFHSLEDRIVKQTMRESGWNIITKKPIIATEEEQQSNRRSRSAKLRIAQKL
jgi:16S rRNA (cytosine1402-N4)-methyltransferase